MPRRPVVAVVAVLAVLAAVVGASPAAALTTRPCPEHRGLACGTVRVPLDRSGAVPGTVDLAVAVERPRAGASGYLLALAGGPGQPSIPYAESFRSSLAGALRHRRLVLVDQRGTGGSGVLVCPALQRLGTLDPIPADGVGACAARLGPRRRFYATADSVADLEAVRAAIGAPKLELMGVSYGTFVATQYARAHPDRVDGLILDSVVASGGVDGFYLDTLTRLPRVLADQCRAGRCRGATDDPIADLRRLAARLAAGRLSARVPDARGRLRRTSIADQGELLFLIMAGDLNPYLQAALPGAIASAVRGDPAPLVRLRRAAQGPPTPARELSAALNVTTTCADIALPYALTDPPDVRWTRWRHGLDAVPASSYAPFSTDAVLSSSVAHDCLRWPQGDTPTPPSTAPLPDVPALLLSGRLDTRTPLENQRSLRAELPQAAPLVAAGTGHDVLDSDVTGCVARALARFAAGRPVGDPCRGRTNAVRVQPRAPRSLADYRRAPGVGGARGRVLFAALDAIGDAELGALQTLYAGFRVPAGGGLRGGRFHASDDLSRLRLARYRLVPSVAVGGTLRILAGGRVRGTLRVRAADGLGGTLRLGRGDVVRGTLGGRAVRYRAGAGLGRLASAGRGRAPYRLPVGLLRRAADRAPRVTTGAAG